MHLFTRTQTTCPRTPHRRQVGIVRSVLGALLVAGWMLFATQTIHAELLAGAAKVDVTDYEAGPVNDPLFLRVIVLKNNATTLVLMGVDAVAIGEIGRISNEYLPTVRAAIEQQFNIDPQHVLINASHCHGVVRRDLAELTIDAVRQAQADMVPVTIGCGIGHEDGIQENRRLVLANGQQTDVRHAYSLPADAETTAVGPIDPEIGIVRIDRVTGGTLAVLYNFACHPIQGVPSGGNTADITGFSSRVIEQHQPGAPIALFWQGCGGDINPAGYKEFDQPRDAETLGNRLGLSTLAGLAKIECRDDDRLRLLSETLELPRADNADRIARMESRQKTVLGQLRGTTLDLKTFLPLTVKYGLEPEYPAAHAHRYLHQEALDQHDLKRLDADNRQRIAAYISNIRT
ncbi:MAG: hypothetical protein KDA58_13280, partial [Planctomycetaceae bacterium]|nr:hypothetical protein [Planctomycetaceae bacterium]